MIIEHRSEFVKISPKYWFRYWNVVETYAISHEQYLTVFDDSFDSCISLMKFLSLQSKMPPNLLWFSTD